MTALPRILHLHAAFDADGDGARCAKLVNAFAGEAEHAIVSGDLTRRSAAALLGRQARVAWPRFPSLKGAPLPGRLKRLAEAMAGYDLLCSYGYGTIDAAMAHTLFADVFKLAPLVHHESALSQDLSRGRRGTFYRRLALGRTSALVVNSRALEQLALESWDQPRSRVRLIPDGIDTRAFAKAARPDSLPKVVKRKGEAWLGTTARLVAEENLGALVHACARLPDKWQLVIVGDGPERDAVLAAAAGLGIEDRVHLPGDVPDRARALALFDIYAVAAPDRPDPVGMIEAMAAGLPIAGPRSVDIAALVASDNGPFLAAPDDAGDLAGAVADLAADPAGRKRVGEANRARARTEFDQSRMIERYRALYFGLIDRRPAAP